MKEIRLKITIDDEALKRAVISNYLLVMRTLAPIAYIIILVIVRVILPSTLRQKIKRTPQKKAVYTAKNSVFTPQNQMQFEPKKERVGAGNSEPEMHSSTLVKCANPNCKEIFPYEKRGNNVKRFCKSSCKDAVHNAKKLGKYHEYKNG